MAAWTEEENRILVEIFASPLKFAAQAHRLTNKTVANIQQTGRTRGLKKAQRPSARTLILDLMADGMGRSMTQISEATEVQKSFCKDLMAELLKAGAIHVCGWSEKYLARIYKCGEGKTPSRNVEVNRRKNARRKLAKIRKVEGNLDNVDDSVLDEAYRLKVEHYPTIDPMIVAAINAMVSVGRVSA